jgi:hypothetical protein
MMKTHSGRPEATDFLEMHRGMPGVPLHQRKGCTSQLLNVSGQSVEMLPEVGCGSVSHRSVHRPSRRSRRASSAR